MRRTTLHIVLLLVLGLYYNGATAVWLAYSTVAKNFFIEHCENPTKPCCKGQCHVKEIADRSGSADESSPSSGSRIQIADPQPTIPTAFEFQAPVVHHDLVSFDRHQPTLHGLLESPFRPPRA